MAYPAYADQTNLWGDWEKVRALYDSAQYEEALKVLKSLDSPKTQADPSYFYNLGNIYFRLNNYGMATAYFEKAKYLAKHSSVEYSPDIQSNLKLAKGQLSQQMGQTPLDPASSTLETLFEPISHHETQGLSGLALLLLFLLWMRPYLKTRNLKKTLFSVGGILGLTCVIIALFLTTVQKTMSLDPPAVVVQADILRSGPGETFVEVLKIQPGIKLRLTGESAKESSNKGENWVQVRYSPENMGWIRQSSLLLLN